MVECRRFQILKIGLAKTNLFRLSIIAMASYMPDSLHDNRFLHGCQSVSLSLRGEDVSLHWQLACSWCHVVRSFPPSYYGYVERTDILARRSHRGSAVGKLTEIMSFQYFSNCRSSTGFLIRPTATLLDARACQPLAKQTPPLPGTAAATGADTIVVVEWLVEWNETPTDRPAAHKDNIMCYNAPGSKIMSNVCVGNSIRYDTIVHCATKKLTGSSYT